MRELSQTYCAAAIEGVRNSDQQRALDDAAALLSIHADHPVRAVRRAVRAIRAAYGWL